MTQPLPDLIKLELGLKRSINADPDGAFKENVVPRRILLVEDNDLNRQMLDDYLGFVDTRFSVLVVALTFSVLADFNPRFC